MWTQFYIYSYFSIHVKMIKFNRHLYCHNAIKQSKNDQNLRKIIDNFQNDDENVFIFEYICEQNAHV